MASERQRLFVHLEQLLGPEDAIALMDRLPDVPTSDLATRADLFAFRDEIKVHLRELRKELRQDLHDHQERMYRFLDDRIDARIGKNTRFVFFGMLAAQSTFVALVLGTVQLN